MTAWVRPGPMGVTDKTLSSSPTLGRGEGARVHVPPTPLPWHSAEARRGEGHINWSAPTIKAVVVYHGENSSACQHQPPSRLPTAGSPQVFI